MERWRRPDALELELTASVSTRVWEAEQFGWELWEGRIWALWDIEHWTSEQHAGERLPLPPEHRAGWAGSDLQGGESGMRLHVGHLERWMRILDLDIGTLLEAADAIAEDLLHVIEAIAGDDEPLREDFGKLTGQPWFDRLLVLRSAELVPQLRGYGIGAWASARSIRLLARDSGTLIVTKAAPLHADAFRQDPDSRELTPAEDQEWQLAQRKIATLWQRSLGLVPLPDDPRILFGTVDTTHKAVQATVDSWTE